MMQRGEKGKEVWNANPPPSSLPPQAQTLRHNKHNIFSFRLMIHEVSISFKSKAMQFFPFKPVFYDSYALGHPHF